ncbi:MAG: type I 3-dehydroquinate dehydratase [Lachnospiraceae bacterium]|nr:type I 3-dehydroquinate dehydratase [Lachnospiraceae bacterium]
MKKGSLRIRNLVIGEGRPKICVPIVGRTEPEIFAQARALKASPADLVEWRVDWFEKLREPDAVTEMLEKLWKRLGGLQLLFTIRTKAEGGEADIPWQEYRELNLAAARSGFADLIDVEMFAQTIPLTEKLVEELKACGVAVVGSSHDFQKTPSVSAMVERMCVMQQSGVSISKLAVTPQSEADVVALLNATWEMKSRYADRPLITMSMGKLGLLSRLSGELFGSAVTFGCVGQASAPGQIEAWHLAEYLEELSEG